MCLLPRLHFLDSILRIRIPKTGSGNTAQTSLEFEILPEPLESWEVWAPHMLSLRITAMGTADKLRNTLSIRAGTPINLFSYSTQNH